MWSIKTKPILVILGAIGLGTIGTASTAADAEKPVILIEIKEHKFVPATIDVPIDTRFVLLVKNLDPTPEEFESFELNREVIIPGNGEKRVNIGPLKPGSYPFFGEFNQATAQGTLVAK